MAYPDGAMVDGRKWKTRHDPDVNLFFRQVAIDGLLPALGVEGNVLDEGGAVDALGVGEQLREPGLLLLEQLRLRRTVPR